MPLLDASSLPEEEEQREGNMICADDPLEFHLRVPGVACIGGYPLGEREACCLRLPASHA